MLPLLPPLLGRTTPPETDRVSFACKTGEGEEEGQARRVNF